MRKSFAFLALALLPTFALASDLPPACDAPAVLGSIVNRQAVAEQNTWHDGVTFTAIIKPVESVTATPHNAVIATRHCAAKATLPNGKTQLVYYVISAEQGMAGYGWAVDYCLPGRDYFHIYDADCRVLR
jgi:hypothetical protein